MSKKVLIPVSIIAGLAVLGIMAGGCAYRYFCAPPEKKAEFIAKRITRTLDLTDQQQVQLEKIKDEILVKVKRLHEDRPRVHKEIIDLVKKERLTRADVEGIMAKHEAKFRELKPFIVEKIVEFQNMLTPEQKNKLAEKMDKFHSRCGR